MNNINPQEKYRVNVISPDSRNINRPQLSNSPGKNVRFLNPVNNNLMNPINRSESINVIRPPSGYIIGHTIPVVTQRTVLPINTIPLNYNVKRSYTAEQLGLATSNSINNLSNVVSRLQYEKSLNQLKNLEVKYNELNLKYLNVINRGTSSDSNETKRLRQQNFELQQKLVSYQNSQRILHENIEKYIGQLVNKYRDATLKETTLLMDRFRLQVKQAQKDNNTRYRN